MRARRDRRLAAGLLAAGMTLLAALALAPPVGDVAAAERERKSRVKHRSELEADGSGAKVRSRRGARGMRSMRRSAPDWPAERVPSLTARGRADVQDPGATIVVSVTMVLPEGVAPRYVALDVGADPDLLRYKGHRPTGRGGLIVRESRSAPGLVTVYRSALDTGFDAVETVVELEFERVGSGEAPLSLSQVRVLDARGRDIGATLSAGELRLD